MNRYHMKEDGEPGVCTAAPGKCPKGDNVEHFDNKDDAWRYSLEKLKKDNEAFATLTKPKANSFRNNLPEIQATFKEAYAKAEGTDKQKMVTALRATEEKMFALTGRRQRNMLGKQESPNDEHYEMFRREITISNVRNYFGKHYSTQEGEAHLLNYLKDHGVDDFDRLEGRLALVSFTAPNVPILQRGRDKQISAQLSFAERRGVDEAGRMFRELRGDQNGGRRPNFLKAREVLEDKNNDKLPYYEMKKKLAKVVFS